MESKIRVEHDFSNGETWVQMYVSTSKPDPDTPPDLRDLALKAFIEMATFSHNELFIFYPVNNQDNSVIQIKVREKSVPPVDLNWVGCNATYRAENDPAEQYLKGETYNLEVATGSNHKVYVRRLETAIVRPVFEPKSYHDLKTFFSVWSIN